MAAITPTNPNESRSASTTMFAFVPVPPANEIFFTDCTGINAFANHIGPWTPGSRPEGWGPGGLGEINAISILVLSCERISVGGFERGPTKLLLEWHSNAEIPPKCTQNRQGFTYMGVLANVVAEDAEIGAHLAATYGMPVSLATFTESTTDTEANALHHLAWTIDGQTSSLSVLETISHPDPQDYERYFWQKGDGLVQFDLDMVNQGPNIDHAANGTMNPPMLLASDTDGVFVGGGDWYPSANATGRITEYADRRCKVIV